MFIYAAHRWDDKDIEARMAREQEIIDKAMQDLSVMFLDLQLSLGGVQEQAIQGMQAAFEELQDAFVAASLQGMLDEVRELGEI